MEINTKIKFIQELAKELDKAGNEITVKEADGRDSFIRNDIVGLNALLRKFDTRRHAVKDWKISIKIKEKLLQAYLKQQTELELTKEEAIFLKDYLSKINEVEGQAEKIQDFELKTLFGILEQLA